MNQWILWLLIAVGSYVGYQKYQSSQIAPLYNSPYLVVYGRHSCGYTQRTQRELEAAGVGYQFMSVDDPKVADVLHSRMQSSGINTRRYLLPVVDLNNQIQTRPDNAELITKAHSLRL